MIAVPHYGHRLCVLLQQFPDKKSSSMENYATFKTTYLFKGENDTPVK